MFFASDTESNLASDAGSDIASDIGEPPTPPSSSHPGQTRTYVRSQCGLCGFEFSTHDKCIPIIKYSKTSHLEAADPVPFYEIVEKSAEYYQFYFCLASQFNSPGLVNVQVTVHRDCFSLFLSKCKVDDVETIAYWMAELTQPWPNMPSLQLDPCTSISQGLSILSEADMPQVMYLPAEIATQIYKDSRSHIVWRYAALMERIEQIHANRDLEHLESVSVCDIQEWDRGREPVLSKLLEKGVIRLTIDSQGLRRIERLASRPQHQASSFSDRAFVIDVPRHFKKMTVDFKYGLAHLNSPGHPRLRIWNRPCPPILEECKGFVKPSRCLLNRITTIDPKQCTGITMYFFVGVLAMQAHTTSTPKINPQYEQTIGCCSCIYLPLPPGEEILAVGAWMTPGHTTYPKGYRYFFRMKLAGDVSFGLWNMDAQQVHKSVLATGPNITLINYKNAENRGLLAACDPAGKTSRVRFTASEPTSHPPFSPLSHPSLYYYANYATAPLDNVTRIQIFENKEYDHCSGLIFDYTNGAQRALGECRFGIDTATTVENPACISICEDMFTPLSVTAYDWTGPRPDPRQKRYPLRGILECWFFVGWSQIAYREFT